MNDYSVKKETAIHTGLLITSLVMAVFFLAERRIEFWSFMFAALLGIAAYSLTHILLLNAPPNPFEQEEDEGDWVDGPENLMMTDGMRIVFNNRVIEVPVEIRQEINAIIHFRGRGKLETVSARQLADLGIASRFGENKAQAIMDWLIGQGIVEQKDRSPGTWNGSLSPSPTPGDGYRSDTTTPNHHHSTPPIDPLHHSPPLN